MGCLASNRLLEILKLILFDQLEDLLLYLLRILRSIDYLGLERLYLIVDART